MRGITPSCESRAAQRRVFRSCAAPAPTTPVPISVPFAAPSSSTKPFANSTTHSAYATAHSIRRCSLPTSPISWSCPRARPAAFGTRLVAALAPAWARCERTTTMPPSRRRVDFLKVYTTRQSPCSAHAWSWPANNSTLSARPSGATRFCASRHCASSLLVCDSRWSR